MKIISRPVILLFAIWIFFFWKTVFLGRFPFPGDLLISQYNPWRHSSYLGYVPGTFPNKAQYFDVIRQLYPWRQLAIDELKRGTIPLWNPYNFSGSPLLANHQSAVFYPLNLVLFVLPFPIGWSFLVLVQPLLGSVFTFIYCRQIGIKQTASMFAGIIYGYALFPTVFLEYNIIGHTILWLPITLYLFEKITENNHWKYKVGFVFTIIASALAGHLQLFLTSLLFIIFYIIFRCLTLFPDKKTAVSKIIYVFSLIGISVAICAFQLWPTLELIINSARVSLSYDYLVNTLLVQPKELFMVIAPDIFGNPATGNYSLMGSYPGRAMYVGILPLFLLSTVLALTKQKKIILPFALGAGYILLLTVKSPVTLLFYKLNIPFISSSSPTNMLFLYVFCMAIMTAFALDNWMNVRQLSYKSFILPIGMLLCIWIFSIVQILEIQTRNLILVSGITIAIIVLLGSAKILTRFKQYVIYVLLIISILDFYYYFQKFNPFVELSLFYPPTPIATWLKNNSKVDRFWGYGTAQIDSNFATQLRIYSPDGYDPLYPIYYAKFISTSKNGETEENFDITNRSDATIAKGFGETDFSKNEFRLKVLRTLSVKYILDRIENGSTEVTFPPDMFSYVTSIDDWRIYKYNKALPKAYLVGKFKTYTSPENFSRILFDRSYDPATQILIPSSIVQNAYPNLESHTLDPNHKVDTKYYGTTKKIFTTTSPSEAFLNVTDTWYPGWIATIDDIPAHVIRTNYAFQAIPVPAGIHTVILKFKPISFYGGLIVSCVGIISLLLIIHLKKHV